MLTRRQGLARESNSVSLFPLASLFVLSVVKIPHKEYYQRDNRRFNYERFFECLSLWVRPSAVARILILARYSDHNQYP